MPESVEETPEVTPAVEPEITKEDAERRTAESQRTTKRVWLLTHPNDGGEIGSRLFQMVSVCGVSVRTCTDSKAITHSLSGLRPQDVVLLSHAWDPRLAELVVDLVSIGVRVIAYVSTQSDFENAKVALGALDALIVPTAEAKAVIVAAHPEFEDGPIEVIAPANVLGAFNGVAELKAVLGS